jgi:hypothetical protein
MPNLTAERLRELLAYDPETGVFTRRSNGRVTGHRDRKGYLRIGIDRRSHGAHRLAFLYMTNAWPIDQVDHINHQKADNRWANLRSATNAQNHANVDTRKTGGTGFRGVWLHRNKYRVRIQHNGRKLNLGSYATPEEASAVYQEAVRRLFGTYARTSGGNSVAPEPFSARFNHPPFLPKS